MNPPSLNLLQYSDCRNLQIDIALEDFLIFLPVREQKSEAEGKNYVVKDGDVVEFLFNV